MHQLNYHYKKAEDGTITVISGYTGEVVAVGCEDLAAAYKVAMNATREKSNEVRIRGN